MIVTLRITKLTLNRASNHFWNRNGSICTLASCLLLDLTWDLNIQLVIDLDWAIDLGPTQVKPKESYSTHLWHCKPRKVGDSDRTRGFHECCRAWEFPASWVECEVGPRGWGTLIGSCSMISRRWWSWWRRRDLAGNDNNENGGGRQRRWWYWQLVPRVLSHNTSPINL